MTPKTMYFDGRLLDHLRTAMLAEFVSAADILQRLAPAPEEEASSNFTGMVKHLDDVRAILDEVGLTKTADHLSLDLEKHGAVVFMAMLHHAHGERDGIADELQTAGLNEASYDATRLVTMVDEYAMVKKSIGELEATGILAIDEGVTV